MATEVLMTTPEASIALGKSHRTVHRLAAEGRLRVAQKLPGPNGAFLFHPHDVQAFKDQEQQEATA